MKTKTLNIINESGNNIGSYGGFISWSKREGVIYLDFPTESISVIIPSNMLVLISEEK